jgi:hypothetical protein
MSTQLLLSVYSPTTRARTLPEAFIGVETSLIARRSFQLPMPASTQPVTVLLSACLRTRLIAADGLPAPVIRPVAPRTMSTRSYSASELATSPPLQDCAQVVGMPSICRLSISKPRAVKPPRLVSYWLTETPVALLTTSVTVCRRWSSMRCSATTDTDCGVWRSDRSSGSAVVSRPVVYEPVPSVVSPSRLALILTCWMSSCSSSPIPACASSGTARLTSSASRSSWWRRPACACMFISIPSLFEKERRPTPCAAHDHQPH